MKRESYTTYDLRERVPKYCTSTGCNCVGDTCHVDDFISWLESEGTRKWIQEYKKMQV